MSTTTSEAIPRKPRLELALAVLAVVAYTILSIVAFPPFNVAEAGYVLAVPLLLWAMRQPRVKSFALGVQLGSWVAWMAILIWLRHLHPPMGMVADVILSFLLALFMTGWFVTARWLFNKAQRQPFRLRLIALLGLSGMWVVLEWMRTWVLFGFPWTGLGVSQWDRPPLLQVAEYAGVYGVSFILIFFNLALAGYVWRLFHGEDKTAAEPTVDSGAEAESLDDADEADEGRSLPYRSLGRSLMHRKVSQARPVSNAMSLSGSLFSGGSMFKGAGRFLKISPELYLALAMVFGSLWFYVKSVPGLLSDPLAQATYTEPMFSASVVQPWTNPYKKWDKEYFAENINDLKVLTERAAVEDPDLIVWPEAATPGLLFRPNDDSMRRWVENLVSETGIPLISGNLAIKDGILYNGIFLTYPGTGVIDEYYAKQKRVPFGEFVPFRTIFPFLGKVVPIDDIHAGTGSYVIPLVVNGRDFTVGPLVCYEDIFPKISRQLVRGGADFLLVVTNDAWYGQEAGATQHMAHSVLRAVETRRPVLRCGNHGWSGWIDEYGRVRDVLTGLDGSIHFQGTGKFDLRRYTKWVGRETTYVRYGDWFVGLSAVLFAWAVVHNRRCA